MKCRPLNLKAMETRYKRFRIALLLDGPGAINRFAERNEVTRNHVTHALSGHPPTGKNKWVKRSARLELAADLYILEVFRRNASLFECGEKVDIQ